jgi:hypothetical protein
MTMYKHCICIAIAMFLAGPALAQRQAAQQPRPHLVPPTGDLIKETKDAFAPQIAGVKLTGNLHNDAMAIKTAIDKSVMADLNYASLMAAHTNTTSSLVRKQCVDAMITLKTQLDGADLKDDKGVVIPKPDPSLVSDVEGVAEVIDALSTTGPLFTSCAGAAQLAKTSTLTLINTILAGATAFTAITPIIP